MKSAVLIAADWPADEVVLVLDRGDESIALRPHLAGAQIAMAGQRLVAVLDRTAFRVLHRYVATAAERARPDAPDGRRLRTLLATLNTQARALAAARDDDRAGDPQPSSPRHAEMDGMLAEAGQ